MSKRAVGSRSIYEAPGNTLDSRTKAGTYQQSPAATNEASGGSQLNNKGPVEMWVSPSQGG